MTRTFRVQNSRLPLLLGFALPALTLVSLTSRAAAVDFDREVRPILARHCFLCHGPDESTRKARLRLDERAHATAPTRDDGPPAIVPGDSASSLLLARIASNDPDFRMPPNDRDGLTAAEIQIVRRWIDEGATYTKHWSWRREKIAPAPSVREESWPRDDIDRFILARLEGAGLRPAPVAPRDTLLRRLCFDLVGLPPSPADLDAFENDDAPGAYERVVDRLLASPHFGERWARHWLDLMRYAETYGHEFDYPIRHAWQYRDYVIRAFNADVPYDRFVTEHIAGDLLDQPRRHPEDDFNESIIGTGFWFLSQGTHGPVDVRGDEAERVANQIDVMSKSFLGLTVSCARCHDHKFDAISTKDYYALAGFLQSSRRQDAYLDPGGVIARSAEGIAPLRADQTRLVAAGLPAEIGTQPLIVAREFVFGDPGGPVEAIAAARRVDPDRLRAWITALTDPALDETAHPLHAWTRIHRPEDPPSPANPSSSSEDRETLFAEFDDLHGWYATGHAFHEARDGRPRCTDTEEGLRLVPAGVAHSGVRANRLRGTLRSETFTIEHDHIHYRMAGRGGRARLIIDGYVLDEFNALLFEGFTINVDTPDSVSFRDFRQDVGRYRGHRAHIELIDDGDRALAVDAIRFSNDPVSVSPPHAPIRSVRALADETQREYENAIARWQRGEATTHDTARLNWMIGEGVLDIAGGEAMRDLAAEIRARADAIPAPMRVLAITDGTPEDEHVFTRGDHRTPGDIVPRRFLASLDAASDPPVLDGSGRLRLAERMLDTDNPLPARVMVNRVWQHLFGQGLVATPDDLGALGRVPTHPDLLDHLAVWFRTDGAWSIKALIRRCVSSNAYRMASGADDAMAEAADPANTLLHRANVRRLSGEEIRDAILAISGRLDPARHGASIPIHLTPFMTGRGRPGRSGPLDGSGRRSVYLEVRRNFLSPMMLAFDTPTPASTIGRRSASNVPAQALFMMNDPFVVEQAAVWAAGITVTEAPDRARIQSLYRAAFARAATGAELNAALAFVEDHPDDPWPDLCHAMFNVKEFIFLH